MTSAMTRPTQTQPSDGAFAVPPGTSARLVGSVVVALLATAALLAGVLVLANRGEWWRGFLPATVVATIAAALSLVPILRGLKCRTPDRMVAFVMLAGGVRIVASVSLGLLAVKVGGYPQASTMLLIVLYYFAVLAVEATVLAKLFWSSGRC